MSTPAAGPDAISWSLATLRGLHPLRWCLAAVGLAATVAVLAGANAIWVADAPSFPEWFQDPGPRAIEFGNRLAERSFFAISFRVGVLAIVLGSVWCVLGCWIARHELLARYRSEPYANTTPIELTPTKVVFQNLKSLVLLCPLVVALCGLLLFPVALAGLLNHLGGVGAIIVALLLPILLIADVILLCIGTGFVLWPLMPVAIAAENGDNFDALSRAYNYAFARPIRFVFFNVIAVAIAEIPLAATLYAVVGPVENWLAASGHWVVWVAAALSVSIFWSLQSLVYLHLRASVDDVDASELAVETESESKAADNKAVEKKEKPPLTPPSRARSLLTQFVLALGLVICSWLVTVWLFMRFGGEDAKWIAWGKGEHFRPDVEGLYAVASLIGGFWGLICFVAPFMVSIRRLIKGDDPANPDKAEVPNSKPDV